jgi:hypothetical protein
LSAVIEKIGERAAPVGPDELVLLLQHDPRKFPTLSG